MTFPFPKLFGCQKKTVISFGLITVFSFYLNELYAITNPFSSWETSTPTTRTIIRIIRLVGIFMYALFKKMIYGVSLNVGHKKVKHKFFFLFNRFFKPTVVGQAV
jgi:hypothetical protein